MTLSPQRPPRRPSLVRSVVPVLLFSLLCGVVGPIFLIMGLSIDGSEPGTGWLLPTGIAITALDVLFGLFLGLGRYGGEVRRYRLRQHGRPATGRVLSFEQTNVRINEQPVVKLRMRIEGDDVTPYEVQASLPIPEIRIPLLYGGALPLLLDRETDQWEIDWTAAPVAAPTTAPAATPTAVPAGGAVPAGPSAADRLAELDSLLARDLVSRDEYDETRARILGEL
ncbi:SHOCT domain-containing protein [Pimelobacter simplex]|uniref:SHOCT domain-containing protein n=1 Tax=Nocardioides simplex TaxID=2045 RepID=A0A7J5E3E1_NOCSI|nr:SHOCT domain-containing protein [Pimelobacter simplex]KAB2812780.1 SHOCT domain-containing protein [Pimelobacter simplex]